MTRVTKPIAIDAEFGDCTQLRCTTRPIPAPGRYSGPSYRELSVTRLGVAVVVADGLPVESVVLLFCRLFAPSLAHG